MLVVVGEGEEDVKDVGLEGEEGVDIGRLAHATSVSINIYIVSEEVKRVRGRDLGTPAISVFLAPLREKFFLGSNPSNARNILGFSQRRQDRKEKHPEGVRVSTLRGAPCSL
jgi:hypothetical protein